MAPDVQAVDTWWAPLAFWFLFLGALAIAVSQLGIAALDNFIAAIGAYIPNIIAAVLIFVIAGVVAAAVGGLVARTMGDTPTGKVVGSVVPVLVMAIATFMILNQLQIATEIVTITYAALIGGVFLAMALAFGLGGREVAGRMLSDAYDKGQEQRGQVRRDMEVGKERGKQDASAPKPRPSSARATAGPRPSRSAPAAPATARPARAGSTDGPRHEGPRGHPADTTRGNGTPSSREVIGRQREEFGGMNWGAAFFGWLVAIGVAALLIAILSAAGAAIGLTQTSTSDASGNAGTVGIVGGIVLLAILGLAYYAGGYVAGRMSRFDGPRQGLGTGSSG